MHRRFWTVYFPIWLARALPLPWLDIIAYRFFGTRVGSSVVLYEGYNILKAQLQQHKETKKEMIKEFEEIVDKKCLECPIKDGKECWCKPLEEIKQKIKEELEDE